MNVSDPHYVRKQAILKEFPEVKALRGRNVMSQFYTYAVVLLHGLVAFYVRDSYLLATAAMLTVGPYLVLCAVVMIHEISHNLIFRTPAANRWLGLLTNAVLVFPLSEVFRQHHNMHHLHLGDYHDDVDVPLEFECRLVGNSTVRKFLWLMLNPLILPVRSFFKVEVKVNNFVIGNFVSSLGIGLVVGYFFPPALLYLAGSFIVSQSVHPSNARTVQRHVRNTAKRNTEQPNTYSYYGPLNAITLNVGYHVEHHDFPHIPWTNLPKLREICGPKWYPDAPSHQHRGWQSVYNFIFREDYYLSHFSGH